MTLNRHFPIPSKDASEERRCPYQEKMAVSQEAASGAKNGLLVHPGRYWVIGYPIFSITTKKREKIKSDLKNGKGDIPKYSQDLLSILQM